MRKLVFLSLFLLMPAFAQAASIVLTWTVASGATVPADTYLIQELISGNWGNLQGTTTATTVAAPTHTFTVINVTPGVTRRFGVTPMANGAAGTRSNTFTIAVILGSDEVLTLSGSGTNP